MLFFFRGLSLYLKLNKKLALQEDIGPILPNIFVDPLCPIYIFTVSPFWQ